MHPTNEQPLVALSIEDIFPYIGEFGRYQKLLLVIVALLYIPVAFHPFLMYFATIIPSWTCKLVNTLFSFQKYVMFRQKNK